MPGTRKSLRHKYYFFIHQSLTGLRQILTTKCLPDIFLHLFSYSAFLLRVQIITAVFLTGANSYRAIYLRARFLTGRLITGTFSTKIRFVQGKMLTKTNSYCSFLLRRSSHDSAFARSFRLDEKNSYA